MENIYDNIWHCELTQVGDIIRITMPVPFPIEDRKVKIEICIIGIDHTSIKITDAE